MKYGPDSIRSVFLLYLATMMLPGIVLMIPVYNLMIQFGLLFFDSSRGQATHLLMAAVALTIIPMIAAFLFLQKQMISGIQLGAVKG